MRSISLSAKTQIFSEIISELLVKAIPVRTKRTPVVHTLLGSDMDKTFMVVKLERDKALLLNVTDKNFIQRRLPRKKNWFHMNIEMLEDFKEGTVFKPLGYRGSQLEVEVQISMN